MIPVALLQPLTSEDCRIRLSGLRAWPGVAVYVLWDRIREQPIYCGTARTPTRLRSHLHKDDLARGPAGKTHVNPALRAYCLAQTKGWLGVSWIVLDDEAAARQLERVVIGEYGIRKYSGLLFNQRLSG